MERPRKDDETFRYWLFNLEVEAKQKRKKFKISYEEINLTPFYARGMHCGDCPNGIAFYEVVVEIGIKKKEISKFPLCENCGFFGKYFNQFFWKII